MKRVRLFAAKYGLECKKSPTAGDQGKKKAAGSQPGAPKKQSRTVGDKAKKKMAGSQPEAPNRPKRTKVSK